MLVVDNLIQRVDVNGCKLNQQQSKHKMKSSNFGHQKVTLRKENPTQHVSKSQMCQCHPVRKSPSSGVLEPFNQTKPPLSIRTLRIRPLPVTSAKKRQTFKALDANAISNRVNDPSLELSSHLESTHPIAPS